MRTEADVNEKSKKLCFFTIMIRIGPFLLVYLKPRDPNHDSV